MGLKLIPLRRGAEMAGKLTRDGAPNPRALKQWIRRENARHPEELILTGFNTVDEHTLAAALKRATEDRTPMMGANRAIRAHALEHRAGRRAHRVHASQGRSLE